MDWIVRSAVLASLMLGCDGAAAQVGSGSPHASAHVQVQTQAGDTDKAGSDSTIGGQALDQDVAVLSRVPSDPLFVRDPFRLLLVPTDKTMNELRKKEGLSFAATYTVVNQYATSTPEGIRHNWGTGRFDLAGGWKAYDHGGSAGSFSLLVRSGTNLGVSQQFNLSDSLGSGLVLNCLPGGGAQRPITLNVLYYRQDFYQKRMAFYIGKIHPNEFISLSLYNNDERTQFLNAENDGNLTIPSDGTYAGGAALEYQVTPRIYIHAVTVDTEGGQEKNLKTLVDKKYMNAVELGWKKGSPTQQEHLFRFVVWRDDTATQGSGAGVGFGSDYELKDGWVPFGRIGIATDKGSSIKRVFDAGLVHIRPFGRRGDMFGASFTLTDPSHGAKHHESLFETFYRVRVTKSLELGPDLEVSIHPTNNAHAYTTALLGARMRIIF
ncbi:Carbohydrate-selective porin OprB [Terriglobus saanensis SP1PR4]|uniref:Carbohydrate-selective porin OprB n=2 Tax=Terriglobus saanensis TaxID=870903 RepID=E8V2P6_TERSS|nr:Carbohydrate-selective porin OprB [Terriglobus saanensis SP1PR4]